MVTEILYKELGVNRGALLPQTLAYNGVVQTLVDFDDGAVTARYDDGVAAVLVLDHPEVPSPEHRAAAEGHEANDSE